ncbi:tetratricopeptide repeat protein [Pedobacter nyackensis]|uniref:tetratricopeptide repeat protein n=1 Tax=Pedobacter nyackensis TaxID=475255 RepID=UPI00292D15C1|nr:tetratricopeptide repeat protein [Pedobacter nyackensis]
MRYFCLILFLLFIPGALFAKFDFNANCLKAYGLIFELKLNAARQLIVVEKKNNPENSIVPLLENYVDFFQLLTTDSKADFDRLKGNKSKRLDQIEDDKEKSPYSLYAQAEINLQWALIRGRFGEQINAAMEIKKANAYLRENAKKYPAFQLNFKGLGLISAVLGSLPDGFMKSTLSTFGIKGDVKSGLAMMQRLAAGLPSSVYEPFYEEVVFYYSFVLVDVAHSENAYAETMKYVGRVSDSSLLKSYLKSYVSAKKGHTEEAIITLANRPVGQQYQSFPYLDYLMGIARLNKLDLTASTYFNKFLQTSKGVSYVKDTYLHLGWMELISGDRVGYDQYSAKVKGSGYAINERDKQAMNEVADGAPNIGLLKARLLFDGGYYAKSLEVLSGIKEGDLKLVKDRVEYFYRLGRNNDQLGKSDEALENYQKAVTYGKSLKAYFAANSALFMGKIYMKKRSYAQAKSCFNTAINMKGHQYENSIESEARDSLKRIN